MINPALHTRLARFAAEAKALHVAVIALRARADSKAEDTLARALAFESASGDNATLSRQADAADEEAEHLRELGAALEEAQFGMRAALDLFGAAPALLVAPPPPPPAPRALPMLPSTPSGRKRGRHPATKPQLYPASVTRVPAQK